MYNSFNDLINDFDKVFTEASKNVKNNIYVDVEQNQDGYIVEASIPGVRKEDIKLDFVDSSLKIRVESKEKKENKGNYYIRERVTGYYPRSIYLKNVDETNLKAKYENGILIVECPFVKKVTKSIKID